MVTTAKHAARTNTTMMARIGQSVGGAAQGCQLTTIASTVISRIDWLHVRGRVSVLLVKLRQSTRLSVSMVCHPPRLYAPSQSGAASGLMVLVYTGARYPHAATPVKFIAATNVHTLLP